MKGFRCGTLLRMRTTCGRGKGQDFLAALRVDEKGPGSLYWLLPAFG